MSDPPPDGCTVCGEGPVQKVLFPVAVHFKGSGFYSTDYGRGKTKPKEGETGASTDKSGDKSPAAASTSDGKSDVKSDSKPSSSGDSS
jgi:hypothetical protein